MEPGLATGMLLHGGITALCRRRRTAFGGRGGRGGRRRGKLGGFRAFPFLVDARGRRIGDEVGWEDVLKGDSAIMALSLAFLRRLLVLVPLFGGGDGTGVIARGIRRVGVPFAIHFVN